jgi:hypothetical protein
MSQAHYWTRAKQQITFQCRRAHSTFIDFRVINFSTADTAQQLIPVTSFIAEYQNGIVFAFLTATIVVGVVTSGYITIECRPRHHPRARRLRPSVSDATEGETVEKRLRRIDYGLYISNSAPPSQICLVISDFSEVLTGCHR